MRISTITTTVPTAADGRATQTFYRGDLPRDPSLCELQISFTCADANPTATVNILPVGDRAGWKQHAAGISESDTVMIQSPTIQAFQLVFAGGGDTKDTIVTTTMRSKSI